MLAYEINVEGLRELEAQLARGPAVVLEELERAMTEADLLLEREVKENMADQRTGLAWRARTSVFHKEQVSDTGVIGLVGSPLNYIVPVELGSKPHYIGTAGIDSLTDWAKYKFGISSEKAARRVAFAVARKIALRGTKAQRPFGRAFQANEAQVKAIFDRAAGRIEARLEGA